jgi:hypothetical protein
MKVDLQLPLASMSTADKIAVMEAIWADLARTDPEGVIPGWHASVLEERERRVASGQEVVLEWSEAKQRLRQEIDARKNP